MATNLRAKIPAADRLLLYDTLPASLKAFDSSQNTTCVRSLPELGEADIVITMVPAGKHVEQIYCSSTGVFSNQTKAKSRVLIDCSTINPLTSIELSLQCKERGWGTFVDAPVSGGTKGAEAGTLSFMVGSTIGSIAQLDDVLGHMGKTIHYCGSVGSGLSAKLCNNYLLALNNLATCETMRMGLALGLDGSVLGRVINTSTGKCWPSEKNNPVVGVTPGAPAEKQYQGGFGIELMIKDLKLAIEAAEVAKVSLPSSHAALKLYETVSAANSGQYSGKDFGVVYQYLEHEKSTSEGGLEH